MAGKIAFTTCTVDDYCICKMCEKLVHVTTTSGKFQHTLYIKLSFLEALNSR